jgi:TRAP transporter 4TM/12TM fusion protein
MYFNSYGLLQAVHFRGYHLAFVLFLTFLCFPMNRKKPAPDKPAVYDVGLAFMGLFITIYMVYRYKLFSIGVSRVSVFDYSVAVVGIILVLEATRRAAGWPLVVLSICFLLYAHYGNWFPGSFKIVPFSARRIVYQIFYTDTGIFGTVLGVSATFVFLFILFGAFLGENGSSEFFNDVSMAFAGHRPGGPGKVAVIASGLMGTISGSAVANVATTGTITIPLMKRIGYKPEFAGAVEAVASSGGGIMPPVMASAAFIMAELLGIPYSRVILAALIPALLYYFSIYVMLHLEAKRLRLDGLPKDQLPSLKHVLYTRGHLAIPLLLLIVVLSMGYTPLFAGFWGIILTILISGLRKETRLSLPKLFLALREGAFASLVAAITCSVVGIVVGVTSMTGLGTMIVGNIVAAANGQLWLALILTMVACLILGMGLPLAACYITAAVMAAPALITLKVPPVAAHMFVLYYAIMSNLTPPVALASFTAAGIADCNPNKVALTGLRLGIAGFLVPIIFAYSPVLLFEGSYTLFDMVSVIISALIGIFALACAAEGYLLSSIGLLGRLVSLIASILLIIPGLITDFIGLALFTSVVASQVIKNKPDSKKKSE